MIHIELKRLYRTPFYPTLGVLCLKGVPFAATLERPWRNNARRVSCIPDGDYKCLRCRVSPDYNGDSPKFGNTFQVFDVEGRKKILFHKGNIEDDTHGCILVGEQFDYINGQQAVLASKHGFKELLNILADVDEFQLSITDHYS